MDKAIAHAKETFERLRDKMIVDAKEGRFASKWKGSYY